eukprot:1589889-Rhodomonas_salina.2
MPGNQLYGLFRGMNHSYAQFREVVDPFIGQYRARIYLDEVELRRYAGMLKGTVGVEHTVDTFIGIANFKVLLYSTSLPPMKQKSVLLQTLRPASAAWA